MKQIVKRLPPPANQIQIDSALLDYTKFGSRGIICQIYENKVSILTKYDGSKFKYAFYDGGDDYNCADISAIRTLERAVDSNSNIYFFHDWKEFAQAVIDNNWH